MPEATPQRGVSATGRVYRILKAGSKLSPNSQTQEAWVAMLGVVPGDTSALLHAIGGFFQQLSMAKAECASRPDLTPDLYLSTLTDIETKVVAGITAGLLNKWGSTIGNLRGPPLKHLHFCADALDRLSDEKEIPQNVLDDLRVRLDEALQVTAESDLEEDTKREIICRLEELRQVILEYRIGGVQPIRRAAEATFGAVVVSYEQAKSKPSGLEVIRTITSAIRLIFEVTQGVYHHFPQLHAAGTILAGLLPPSN